MKYLVFGVNGMAGHMIALYLKEQGHTVVGFAKREGLLCETIIGDAFDTEAVKRAIATNSYHAVINCIGILNQAVDKNRSEGIYLNSVFPHVLSDLCSGTNIKVIHISTDCVFCGDKGSYIENSETDAESVYGKSKALGELIDNKNLTIRTSIIGPELGEGGIGLFHWFMNQKGNVEGFKKVMWTGVTTLQLAKAIEAASIQNISGLYHLVNNTAISKNDLLCLFNKYCKNNTTTILENNSYSCDKSLVNTRNDFNFIIPSYEQMVLDMSEWIKSHQHIYSQYL